MTDCVLALSQTKLVWWCDYGSQSAAGIILHIIIVLLYASIAECFQRHLMFYTCNYNIRVTHKNGAIKHIFYESTRRDHQQIVLYLFCRSMLALHLAVKILLQIFLYEDLSTLNIHTSVGCISLQNASRTALCYATNTIK